MALLLSLETSTHEFSCALHQDEKLIAFDKSLAEQTTASMLAAKIDAIFSSSGLSNDQLSAVVVAAGPGSYTGLRIGVATAKGICYALHIPLISVNTLGLMYRQFKDHSGFEMEESPALFCPMLDARRMEVYCSMIDNENRVVLPTQARVIDEGSFAEQLSEKLVYFFGEGAEKCKAAIRHPNARFVVGIKPSAAFLGVIGFERYIRGEVENPDRFEPLYLKDFIVKKPNLIS